MKKTFLLAIIASTLIVTGCSWNKQPINDAMMKKDDAMKQDEVMTKKEDTMMVATGTTGMIQDDTKMMSGKNDAMMQKNNEVMMQKEPASYQTYSEPAVSAALKSGKKVVLFFHAPWCPTCRSLDVALVSHIATFPENSIVFKVDYDSSTDLKKTYGVTSQHTLVRIDANMNLIAKNIGGDTDDIIKLLQ